MSEDEHYMDLSAAELQKRNVMLKRDRENGRDSKYFEDKLTSALESDSSVRVVIVCFTDLEGKLHLLDYNKDFFLRSTDNLTFDGSSINGFSELCESDLRLYPDWSSFRWLPASIFGPGKVMVFGRVANQDGTNYDGDMRSRLGDMLTRLREERGMRFLAAPEIEGHLLAGTDSEQLFSEGEPFELATISGYFSSLPQDDLRQFIDTFAKALLTLGFEMEKDHPEVSPAQFEVNFRYTDAIATADQILIYKLIARQIAKTMGFTATFLPKPFADLNGNGMHMNMSVSQHGKNIFFDGEQDDNLSATGRHFAAGILSKAKEICLGMVSSVNGYRRLDPNFEAPNEIKMSSKDRGSMVRIPVGNEKSARIEVRTVSPDANPYLLLYMFARAGMSGMENEMEIPEEGEILPENIHSALCHYTKSEFMASVMGKNSHRKYGELKQAVADRSPRHQGTYLKTSEVIHHHEVTNQHLWEQF